jgi:hypothetical protein
MAQWKPMVAEILEKEKNKESQEKKK